MTPFLIDVRYKDYHAKAGESVVCGLALGLDQFDACYRLLRREGLTAEAIKLGPETYFEGVPYTNASCETYHLFNQHDVPYLMVTFDRGANFLRWFLSHRDPEGVRGPKSWWKCEGVKCEVCVPQSGQPFNF